MDFYALIFISYSSLNLESCEWCWKNKRKLNTDPVHCHQSVNLLAETFSYDDDTLRMERMVRLWKLDFFLQSAYCLDKCWMQLLASALHSQNIKNIFVRLLESTDVPKVHRLKFSYKCVFCNLHLFSFFFFVVPSGGL